MQLTFAVWRFVVPFTAFKALQQRFTSKNVTRIAVISDRWVNIVIVTDDIRSWRNVWSVACNHWKKKRLNISSLCSLSKLTFTCRRASRPLPILVAGLFSIPTNQPVIVITIVFNDRANSRRSIHKNYWSAVWPCRCSAVDISTWRRFSCPFTSQSARQNSFTHQNVAKVACVSRRWTSATTWNFNLSAGDCWRFRAPINETLRMLSCPSTQLASPILVADQRIVFMTRIRCLNAEACSILWHNNCAMIERFQRTAIDICKRTEYLSHFYYDTKLTFASRCCWAPHSVWLTLPGCIADQWVFFRALVLDGCADREILPSDCRVVENVGWAARKRRMLANEVKVIKIATDVIPKPVPSAVENYTILFAVVVVWLILPPSWLHHNVTCWK